MSERKMTIKEVLELVVNNLSGISVPVALTQQIATPISQSIMSINACLEAMGRQNEQEAAAANQEPASQAWREESEK